MPYMNDNNNFVARQSDEGSSNGSVSNDRALQQFCIRDSLEIYFPRSNHAYNQSYFEIEGASQFEQWHNLFLALPLVRVDDNDGDFSGIDENVTASELRGKNVNLMATRQIL